MVPRMIERRFKEEDLPNLLELLKTAYNRWHSKEYWTWKYEQNPHGSPLIWVAEDKGKIVGCYILNPVKIRLGQAVVLGAQSVDAAVDPSCRGGGIFKKLAINTITYAPEEGVIVTFAFPTEYAFKGQVRMGYKPMFILPKMYKIFNIGHLLDELGNRFSSTKISRILKLYEKLGKHSVGVSPEKQLSIKRIDNFDLRFEEFWRKVSEKNTNILIERDIAYLNWRYFKHPEKSYVVLACEEKKEVVGYAVLSVDTNVSTQRDKPGKLSIGNIIDFLVLPERLDAGFQLISHSLDYFECENVDIAGCWMFKRHPYYGLLKKFGFSEYYELFRRVLLRPKYIDQVIMYINSKSGLRNALKSKQTNAQLYWFIMPGDADYT